MEKDVISLREAMNDGKTIHLYYDDIVGVYLAFGLSAYFTTKLTEPYVSYSEAQQMPVALLRQKHVQELQQSLDMVEHTARSYYRFTMSQQVEDAGYDTWASGILSSHNQVAEQTGAGTAR